jgi:hypothetical protein
LTRRFAIISSDPKTAGIAIAYFSAGTSVVYESSWTLVFDFSIRVVSLGKDDNAFSWNLVLFEKFTEDNFGLAIS